MYNHPNEDIPWANELLSKDLIPVIHSSRYLGPETFNPKIPSQSLHVAVIGIGSSALDISLELAELGHKVSVCSSGTLILPSFDDELNLPFDHIFLSRKTDKNAELDYEKKVCRKATEIFTLHGMPIPSEDSDRITILKNHKEYFKQIKNGNIRFFNKINGFLVEKKNVNLQIINGSVLNEVDAVLLCTGYRLGFPFLRGDHSPLSSLQNYVELYKHILHPKYNTLFFVGAIETYSSAGVVAELQSRWIAEVLTGKIKLPSDIVIQDWVANTKKYDTELNSKTPLYRQYIPLVEMYLKDLDISIPKGLWSDSDPLIAALFREENWNSSKIGELKSKL